MENILIFLGMAAVTFFTRYTMIAALGRDVPPLLKRWLHYVPPAVLAALIAPAVFAPQGRLALTGLPVVAFIAGVLAAWRTRNTFVTILVGTAAYWLARLLLAL